MARVKEYTLTGFAADDNGLAVSQGIGIQADDDAYVDDEDYAEDVALTLEAAAADIDPPRPLIFSSATDESATVFAVVGVDQNGNAVSENVTGVDSGNPQTTVNLYSSITSITPDADSASTNTINVGHGLTDSPLVLEAAAAALDPPREIELDAGGDVSSVVFTVVGKNRWGDPVVEEITGVTTSAVRSQNVFSSVESITPSAATAQTIIAGWPARTTSPWVICGRRTGDGAQLPICRVSILATLGVADGIVEVTYDSNQSPFTSDYPRIFDNPKGDVHPIDESITVTPGTPVNAQGIFCRAVLTTGEGTAAKARFAQPGP